MSRIRTYFQRHRKTKDDIISQCKHKPKNLKDRIIKDYRYIETMISLVFSDYDRHGLDSKKALEEIRKYLSGRN
jgi:hypothetical protein